MNEICLCALQHAAVDTDTVEIVKNLSASMLNTCRDSTYQFLLVITLNNFTLLMKLIFQTTYQLHCHFTLVSVYVRTFLSSIIPTKEKELYRYLVGNYTQYMKIKQYLWIKGCCLCLKMRCLFSCIIGSMITKTQITMYAFHKCNHILFAKLICDMLTSCLYIGTSD